MGKRRHVHYLRRLVDAECVTRSKVTGQMILVNTKSFDQDRNEITHHSSPINRALIQLFHFLFISNKQIVFPNCVHHA